MRIVAVVLLVLLAVVVSPALAQTAPPSAAVPAEATPAKPAKTQDQGKTADDYTLPVQPRGRYSYAPVDEGFLRFDHKDGEVALCKPGPSGGWSCEAVDDKTASGRQKEQADNEKALAALRDDIAGVKNDIDGLKKDIAALHAPPPPLPSHPVPPDTVPPSDETGSITLKHDIARARGFIAHTWQRLVNMIETMRKDIIRKGNDTDLSRT
jgi:hypothetical protein